MKKHQRLIVYLSFLIGLPAADFVIPHQMPDRTFMTVVGGAIALADLEIFYYRRYGEPGYDVSSGDLERYELEVVAFAGFCYLLLYIALSRFAR